MNNQNKVNLILFIAQTFNDEMCKEILKNFTNRISNQSLCFLANTLNWKESEHPRAKDGKFTDLIGDGGETPRQIAEREYRDALKAFRKKYYGEPKEGENDPITKKALEAKKRLEQIKQLEPEIDRRDKMTKKAKEFYKIEDDIDELEELYGDNELGGKLKFSSDDKGKADKKRYKALKRRSQILKSQINWDDVDDDEINAEREAASKE